MGKLEKEEYNEFLNIFLDNKVLFKINSLVNTR